LVLLKALGKTIPILYLNTNSSILFISIGNNSFLQNEMQVKKTITFYPNDFLIFSQIIFETTCPDMIDGGMPGPGEVN